MILKGSTFSGIFFLAPPGFVSGAVFLWLQRTDSLWLVLPVFATGGTCRGKMAGCGKQNLCLKKHIKGLFWGLGNQTSHSAAKYKSMLELLDLFWSFVFCLLWPESHSLFYFVYILFFSLSFTLAFIWVYFTSSHPHNYHCLRTHNLIQISLKNCMFRFSFPWKHSDFLYLKCDVNGTWMIVTQTLAVTDWSFLPKSLHTGPLRNTHLKESSIEKAALELRSGSPPSLCQDNTDATQTQAEVAVQQMWVQRYLTLTDSDEIFIKSSGPGVPTSVIISFNWSMSTTYTWRKTGGMEGVGDEERGVNVPSEEDDLSTKWVFNDTSKTKANGILHQQLKVSYSVMHCWSLRKTQIQNNRNIYMQFGLWRKHNVHVKRFWGFSVDTDTKVSGLFN